MRSIALLRNLDSRAWVTATWAMPFMTQGVLAASAIALWLLGKTAYFGDSRERAWVLAGAVVTILVWLPVSFLLLGSGSSRVRGLAVSVAASSMVVSAGLAVIAFWTLRW